MGLTCLPNKNNFALCTAILKHCNLLFLKGVEKGTIQLPEQWKLPASSLGLYLYSSVEDLLYFTDGDAVLLKQLGFLCDVQDQVFLPWFKNPGIQICPVDLETQTCNKPNDGWVRDVPIFFKKIHKTVINEGKLTKEKVESKDTMPVFVTSDPLDAMLLIASGFLAVGLGTNSVLKGQLKHLSQLQRPLIFLGEDNKKTEQAAELFVYALERYSRTFVMFTPKTIL